MMKAESEANYLAYKIAPPPDDARPEETSWTCLKKLLDGRGKAAEPLG
jgi:hypothetical protein